MTPAPANEQDETIRLAGRFLYILEALSKFTRHRLPDDTVGHLNLNQIITLHMLHRHPGLAQKDIAERLQITAAAVSTAMRELETLGLIERRSDEADARAMRLYLSQPGQVRVDRAIKMRRQVIAELLSALPLPEQQTIVESLERALAARDNIESGIQHDADHT